MSSIVFGSPVMLGLITLALTVAQMQLPDDFQAGATRISVSGFGGKNKGSFAFSGHSGEFTRGESRL
ncbi:MAG: hypothetical protein WBM54_00755, partial [Woeseia sp.]